VVSEKLHLYQVADGSCTPDWQAEEGFLAMRPMVGDAGWAEYGPIARFLRGSSLDEDAHYGFFVPGFTQKTGCSLSQVREMARASGADADALLFSEHPHNVALFRNVFERGEFFAPGLMEWARAWFEEMGVETDPGSLVMGVEQMVLSNCFTARPRFWRRWLELCASLRRLFERSQGSAELARREPIQVELMRCVAPYMLTCEPGWRARSADPFVHGRYPMAWMRADPTDLVVAAAMKHAYKTSNWRQFVEGYLTLRREIVDRRSSE